MKTIRKSKRKTVKRSMAFAAAVTVAASALYAPLSATGVNTGKNIMTANAEDAIIDTDSININDDLCQAENLTEGDYTYTVSKNEVSIASYTGKDTDLVIPGTIGGMPVVTVSSDAFKENTTLKSVVFPESVKTIASGAFEGDTALTSVTFPEGLETLGYGAFSGTGLTSVKIPSTLKSAAAPFDGCETLEKAEFADGTVNIPYGSLHTSTYGIFENCTSLKEVVLPEGIETINYSAFYNCKSLAEIKLPSTIKNIRENAFNGASSIKEIELPEGLETLGLRAFAGTQITSVKIPSTVKQADMPFRDCDTLVKAEFAEGMKNLPSGLTYLYEDIGFFENSSKLEEVILPEGLEYIEYAAFRNCPSLKKINFPSTLKGIGRFAFCYDKLITSAELPEGLKSLSASCFAATGLTEIKIPSTVTYACHPFELCESLKKCEFAEGMTVTPSETSMEKLAPVNSSGIFHNCPALEEIVFPDSLEVIGHFAFADCPSLKDVKIPDNIKGIGSFAFSGDTGIESIELPSGLEYMYVSAFGETSITEVKIPASVNIAAEPFKDCEKLKKVEFEEGMTATPSCSYQNQYFGVMEGCPALEEIVFPDSMETLRKYAFEGCTALKKVVIPDNVESIGEYAFANCTALQEVIIPSSVFEIKDHAFENDAAVQEIEFNEGLEYLGDEAFKGTSLKSVKLPVSLVAARRPFAGCNTLKKAEFAEGTTFIADNSSKTYNPKQNNPSGIFHDCTSLETVIIPEGVTDIGTLAFGNCTSLKNIKLPSTLKNLGSGSFLATYSLKSIEIPEGVEDLGLGTFAKSAISHVKIPSTVTGGSKVFQKCNYLTSAEIADGLKTLPYTYYEYSDINERGDFGIFYDCPVLKEVKIPDSLEVIDRGSFKNCPMLELVDGGRDEITIKSEAFDGCPKLDDERFLILDKANSYITANTIVGNLDGTVNVTLKCRIADRFVNKVTKKKMYLNLPKSLEYVEGSFRCSDPDAKVMESYLKSGIIDVTPANRECTVSFTCKILNQKDLNLEPSVGIYIGDEYFRPFNGDLQFQNTSITIGAPRYVSEKTAEVYGVAEIGKDVKIFVNGDSAATVTAGKTGRYTANVKLPDGNTGNDYTIYAECADIESEDVTVTYVDKAVTLEKAEYSDNHFRKLHDITSVFTEGKSPVIATYIGNKMKFDLKLLNAEDAKHVYVTSEKGGEVKYIEAVSKNGKDEWHAEGFFDENNHYYVPGELNVSVVKETEIPSLDIEQTTPRDTLSIGGYSNKISSNSSASVIVNENDRLFAKAVLSDGTDSIDYGYFSASAEKLSIGGKEVTAKDVAAAPDKYGFTQLPLYIVEEGDKNEYYYMVFDSNKDKTVMESLFDAKDLAGFNEHKGLILIKKSAGTSEPVFMIHGVSDLASAETDIFAFDLYGIFGDQLGEYGGTLELRRELTAANNDELVDVFTMLYGSKLINAMAENDLSSALSSVGGLTGPWAYSVDSAIILGSADLLKSYGKVMAKKNPLFTLPGYIRFIIDPSGTAYEAVKGNPVEDVSVTIYYKDENGKEVKWDAEEYDQENPLITNSDGWYAWDVPEGEWKIKASKDGYDDAESEWLNVPPVWTDVNIAMVSHEKPVLEKAECTDGKVTVHFSRFMDISTVSSSNFSVSGYSDINVVPVLLSNDDAYADTFEITGKVDKSAVKDNTVTVKASGAAKSYSGAELTASEVKAEVKGDITAVVTTTAATTVTTTTTTAASTTTTAKPTTTTTAATTTTTAKPTTTTTAATTTTTAKPTTTTTVATTTTTAKPTTTTTAATTTTTAKSTTTTTAATTTTTAKSTTTTAAATTTTTAKSTTTTAAATTTTASTTTTAPAYIPGDVNNDGIVDGRDASTILAEYAAKSTGKDYSLNESAQKAADYNKDGIIDGRDAADVLAVYALASVGEKKS